MDGTVVGSLYGLFAALYAHRSEGYDGSLGWMHFTLLVLWVLGCGFVREGNSPYGGFVAQFTPFIMVEIPNYAEGVFNYESWALMRISQNMLAVIVFVVVELVLLPAMSSLLIRWRLVKDLHFAAKAARAVWDTEMEGMCSKCQQIRSDDADAAIKDLQAGATNFDLTWGPPTTNTLLLWHLGPTGKSALPYFERICPFRCRQTAGVACRG